MELKEVGTIIAIKVRKFQSHLYGIERYHYITFTFRAWSFNRTFMELKV